MQNRGEPMPARGGAPDSPLLYPEEYKGDLFDAMSNKKVLLGQSAIDLIWWAILLVVIADVAFKAVDVNLFHSLGLFGGFSVNQTIVVDVIIGVLAASQVFVDRQVTKHSLNTIIHVILMLTVSVVVSGFNSVSEMASTVATKATDGPFEYHANVAQPAATTDASCTFFNAHKNRALTAPEKQWCIDKKATGLNTYEKKACGC